MNRYNITYWDGQSANVIQCMDIDELITELQKLSGNAQYIDVQTVLIPFS